MKKNDILLECKKIYSASNNCEDVVAYLYGLGISKFLSIVFIAESGIASLAQAKEVVHKSVVWESRKISDEEFHSFLAKNNES